MDNNRRKPVSTAITVENLSYTYPGVEDTPGVTVFTDLNLTIEEGSFVAVLGGNGCGKSTLAKHFNSILLPCGGKVYVCGLDTSDEELLIRIRRNVGMVFQNPDNQIVANVVEEDVAFGPRNLGLSEEEVSGRVIDALREVGAEHLLSKSPTQLSGGEKRRIAIATTLSMTPSILVMDEPTANLDPKSRRQLITLLGGFDHTLLLATHDMDLAAELCRRIVILSQGEIMADGSAEEIFLNKELLESCSLEQPYAYR